jgi:hypothetical protein
MTKLAYAARNFLAQQESVTSLLGSDDLGPWIFVNQPEATVENTGDVLVVISSTSGWGANGHNTARFPVLIVDIWADPTRDPASHAVMRKDADLKVERVFEAIDKFLHLTHRSVNGDSVIWGTPDQVTNRTGVRIIASERQDEPTMRPAFNDEGAIMGSVRYNVSI